MSETRNHASDAGTVVADGPYIVQEVAGRPPSGLDDVVGATTLTVTRDGLQYRVVGTGAREDDVVLFHQKEVGSAAEDFLIWTIVDAGNGDLVARPPLIG